MGEMPNVDPNFGPRCRPRSGTWPMNRPNIDPRKSRMQGVGTVLGATLEEANSQELLASESGLVMDQMPIKEDYLALLSPSSMLTQSDFDSVLIGSPTASLVTDFSAISPSIKTEACSDSGNLLSGYCSATTITELSNIPQDRGFDEGQSLNQQRPPSVQCQNSPSVTVSYTSTSSSLSKTSSPSTTVSGSQPATSGATPKAKSTRKNAWGNMSYADLITQAIEASPEQRLTLAQIYEWMVKNVPYFKDKGDSNSSAGWKNSIRHNLSLHAKFKRIQNEGTGKSSWWVINHDAKPGKSPRRPRSISMDNANTKYNRSRSKAIAKQKAELIKKQKAGIKSGQTLQRDSGSWSHDINPGLETPVSKALGSEYRPRASSNASSLSGRISPSRGLFLAPDLEDDGAPPLSPLSGSNNNLANLSTSLPSAFNNIFDIVRQDNMSSAIPETEQVLHDNLLESLASMDVVSSPASYSPDTTLESKDRSGMYLQAMNGCGQSSDMKNLTTSIAQNSPNLANLLQKKTNSVKKSNNSQPNMPAKVEQCYDADGRKVPFPYTEYRGQQVLNQAMQPPLQYKAQPQTQVNEVKPLYHYVLPQQNLADATTYNQGVMQQPMTQQLHHQQQTQHMNYIPQHSGMTPYVNDQCQQPQQITQLKDQQQESQYSAQPSNLLQMNQAKFPSDINLENQELFDSGDMDINEMLQDIPSPNYAAAYNFSMDNGGYLQSFQSQMQTQSNDYNLGVNGSNSLADNMCQQQQPVLHPNPDVFITNAPSGNSDRLDIMMDGCRMNNSGFQHVQQNQPSAIGGSSAYGMQ